MNTQAEILPQNWNYSLNYIGTFQNLNSYNAINTYLTKGKKPLIHVGFDSLQERGKFGMYTKSIVSYYLQGQLFFGPTIFL